MKNKNINSILWLLAGLGLLLTILPPILVFTRSIEFSLHTTLMTVGMFVWFGARIGIQAMDNR
ncbi:hypothetical protein KUV50_10430 [Membranicola marinus]|uniref:Uncharacterized protein n=1 Tax=Membranihabitans marinus TaxID=1227546 RepID=A0A953HU93_9BACT|nr:hypothetical protein [Membranihabitans marinus]MBY5958550.1 hypothetical protein [Membranihabitans marinus]